MKSFDTELAKYAKKTRLKATERADIRARILTYMEYHPLPKELQGEKKPQTVADMVTSYGMIAVQKARTLSTYTYARVGAAAFTLLLVVSSLPFAAERSVPGDVLYPIKTNFNETLFAQFANSPYEKVTLETELMERRISEARLLAKVGKLTEEVEASIAADVRDHATAVQQGIAALKVSDADEAAIAEITFGSALEVQTAVLDSSIAREEGGVATLSMMKEVSSEEGNDIASVVRQAKANADAAKGIDIPSYDRLHARVELEVARAYELFSSTKNGMNDEERRDIERRLGDIERKITEAENIHASDVSGDGAPELVEALSTVRKVISFMTDIDVRENVDIEELVPLTLTFEERVSAALGIVDGAAVRIEELSARASTTENATTVAEGKNTLTGLLERASSARETRDVNALEGIAEEVRVLMESIEALFGEETVSNEGGDDSTVHSERSTSTAAVVNFSDEV